MDWCVWLSQKRWRIRPIREVYDFRENACGWRAWLTCLLMFLEGLAFEPGRWWEVSVEEQAFSFPRA